jgi:hypothetical protein
MSYAVAQLVEALRYKPEGRGFDFRWGLRAELWRCGHSEAKRGISWRGGGGG